MKIWSEEKQLKENSEREQGNALDAAPWTVLSENTIFITAGDASGKLPRTWGSRS